MFQDMVEWHPAIGVPAPEPRWEGCVSVSMKDVAAKADVSLGTVSNVLNHPEMVAPRTREKVERVIRELGFVPNATARNLRSGRAKVLGLVVPDIANPFFTEVARGAEDAALEAGYVVIVGNSDEQAERAQSEQRAAGHRRRHVDQLDVGIEGHHGAHPGRPSARGLR